MILKNYVLYFILIPLSSQYCKLSVDINKNIESENYPVKNLCIISPKANFILAYNRTMKFEGYYANDKKDRGGETYKGIARNFHNSWEGWKLIDSCKVSDLFPKNLLKIYDLEKSVQKFYRKEYWDKIRGDEIISQEIANDLFDSCVNRVC